MMRTTTCILFFVTLLFGCGQRRAPESKELDGPPKKDAPVANLGEIRKRLNEQAEEIAKAVVTENWDKVADMTHPSSLKMMGGRAMVIALQKSARKNTIESGGRITIERVEEPGPVVPSGRELYSYVPVVARLQPAKPRPMMLSRSFFIAVSGDKGKTWKFIDDSGLPFREGLAKMLPNMPVTLILPPQEVPMIIEE